MPLLDTGGIMQHDEDEEGGQQNPDACRITERQLRFSQSKLKAASNTSALLVGFAMVALVEFELRSPGRIEEAVGNGWLIAFGVSTSLLISVHLIALIMSVCILPQMEYYESVREQPHRRFRCFIELSWILSTVLGLLLFLFEVGVMCMIKFGAVENTAASYSAVAVLAIALLAFLMFIHYFYRALYRHKIAVISDRVRELEKSYESLDMLGSGTGGGKKTINNASPKIIGRPVYSHSTDAIFV